MPARAAVERPHAEPSQIDRALIQRWCLIPLRGMNEVIRHKGTFGSWPAKPAPVRPPDQADAVLPPPSRTEPPRASGAPTAPAEIRSEGSCTSVARKAGTTGGGGRARRHRRHIQ